MASLPAISSLQTLSAANAAWVPPASDTAAIASAARTECLRIISDSLTGTGGYSASNIRNAETFVHDRAGGRVLQELFLLRKQVVLDAERRQRGLVESGKYELLLARIRIDVAHGKYPGHACLKHRRIDRERFALQGQPPFGDGSELGVQTEEHQDLVAVQIVGGSVITFDTHAFERLAIGKQ